MTDPTVFEHVDMSIPTYRGKLTPRDVGRGVLAAHRNARRLFRDAVFLLEGGRYPSAVGMAILAHEEASKPSTISMIGATEPIPALRERGRLMMKQLWKQFGDHTEKNVSTLNMHRAVGRFPEDVRERVEKQDPRPHAEGYVRLRERSTYVDCVQGAERWSTPGMGRDNAIVMLSAIRAAIQRIATPAVVAESIAKAPVAARVNRPEWLAAMVDWSKTEEAALLSRVDLEENAAWGSETRAALDRVAGRPLETDPRKPGPKRQRE